MMKAVFLIAILIARPAMADILVAAHTMRSHSIIMPSDVTLKNGDLIGALAAPDAAIGLETRVVLYAGRPIRPQDLGPPAIVDRNQIVMLVYRRGGLRISTEGRSLGRGGAGDFIRVMNLKSRATIAGRIDMDGTVIVGP